MHNPLASPKKRTRSCMQVPVSTEPPSPGSSPYSRRHPIRLSLPLPNLPPSRSSPMPSPSSMGTPTSRLLQYEKSAVSIKPALQQNMRQSSSQRNSTYSGMTKPSETSFIST